MHERRQWRWVCLASFIVFAFFAGQVALRGSLAAVVDPAVSHWLAAHRSQPLTGFMQALTQLHSTVGIDAMVAVAALVLALRERRVLEAVWLVVAVESSMLLNVGLKNAFARPRPELEVPLVQLPTFSFPSGHALASTIFWTCALSLLSTSRARTAAAWAAAYVVVLVCLSRVYLGAHYLSDVMAGVTEGLFCLGIWRLALEDLRHRCAGWKLT